MATATRQTTPPKPEDSTGLKTTRNGSRKTGTASKNTGNNSNNLGTSVSNTGTIYGQQIVEIKQQYFTTISDKTSHKNFAESSFKKYQNLRTPETCEWLLGEPGYQAWAKCKGRYIQISGKVGCGKSTLVSRAIEDAQKTETPRSGHKVLYFFASKDVDQGNLTDVDEPRLKDLQPTLKNVLLTFWDQLGVDEDGGIGGGATKDLSQAELVDGIIWRLRESKTTHISMFIDAFDALSESDRGELQSTLLEVCRNDKRQVSLLTSHTQAGTTSTANGEIHVTADKNGEDIKSFLRAKLSEKPLQQDEAGKESKEEKDLAGKEQKKEEKDEVEEIVEKISNRAQEMFLWAAVMLDLVRRAHDKKERENVLERFLLPKSIQDDYEKLVEGWEGKTARGRLEEWQRRLARQATGLLAHKQGLLSYEALMEVLEEELREAAVQKRAADEVMKCCSPFIEYGEDLCIFRFAHPSMHDFFFKRDASRTAFADQTLAYLCQPAFRCGPFSGAEWWDMGELRPFLDSHPFLGFAAANWVDAVRNSKADNGQNCKSTRNLLADLYGADDNLLLAFQVWRFAAHNTMPTQLRSAHVFSFFGLFDNLFSSSSRFTVVHDAAMTDSDGHNALHWALQANDQYTRLQTVRILIRADKAADMVAAQGSSDLTPLHHAARQGDLGVVRLLLSRDPDKRALNVYSKQYGTPLTMAAAHGRVHVVEELIKAGADLDVKCDLGNVLHAAAAAAPDKAAHACVDAILCKHPSPRRFDVDHSKQDGTPLHTAAYYGRQSVVKLLLEKGFSARKRSWKHRSTITAAAAGCHRGTDYKPFIRIMEMLHDAGANAHAAGITGYFALHHAAQFDQPEIARFLHNCGAKCLKKSIMGTPLEVAASQGHMEVARVLLQPREKRQRAYMRKKSERQQRQAEKTRQKQEEKNKKSTSRDESILRRVILAVWAPIWDSAVAANDMTRIYWLVDQYEQACGAAIQQKASRNVKGLAPLGTAVFTSVAGLVEQPREPQLNQQKSTRLRQKARQVLSSTTKGVLKLHAVCDTTLSYFQLKVYNDRRFRSAAAGTEFHPGTYEEILDRLTLAAVRMLSRAFEHDNLDAVPPLAEAWIDALLAIESVGLLEKLVGKRAQALKVILTDTSKTAVEKRRDAGILAKVGIELLAVALRRRGDDAGAARLACSLAKLWATALHDAGGNAQDATRVEDINYVCNAFLEIFRRACELPSSSTSELSERVKRVRLLALVGAEIVVESVKTDNEPLIDKMRHMMDLGRKQAFKAGLKDDVEEVLMEKHDSLKDRLTEPAKEEKEKCDSIINMPTSLGQDGDEAGGNTGGDDEDSNDKSNARESGGHESSEGGADHSPNVESSESQDGKSETDEEVENRRLRITLQILWGDQRRK